MYIRPEHPSDIAKIYELTTVAFAPMPFSYGTEADIINSLRDRNELVLSLVAVDGDEVVGHIAFSCITINGHHKGWHGLGPVSVTPTKQRQSIGSQLIYEGLDRLRMQGAAGCTLVGDPKYYNRFGFKSDGKLTYQNIPVEYVQWLSFGKQSVSGVLEFSSAFSVSKL